MWTAVKKTLALVALGAVLDAASAIKVELTNMCAEEFDLSHLGAGSIISVEKFAPGSSKTKELPMGSASQLFKAGTGAQATLAEITVMGGKVWLDISIIPTGKVGPGYCSTFEECKRVTGGHSYNLPMQLLPSVGSSSKFPTCQTITCMSDGCPEAYLFPKDDTKTKVCPGDTDVKVIFCPGGPGGKTPAPTTPAPTTPAPTTPEPTTPAPTTPEPTTPAPSTPAPAATENSELSSVGGGFLGGSGDGNSTASNEDRSLDAGAATPAPVADVTPAPATVIGAPEVAVQEVNNKSGTSNAGNGAGLYVVMVGAAAMVAGSVIFVVRKKKKALEALDEKTPRPDTTRATGTYMLTTPQESTVL